MGAEVSSPVVDWQVREHDHLPPPGAEVKSAWSYASTPLYVFMAWYLIEYHIMSSRRGT
jgi:hypothetical protein